MVGIDRDVAQMYIYFAGNLFTAVRNSIASRGRRVGLDCGVVFTSGPFAVSRSTTRRFRNARYSNLFVSIVDGIVVFKRSHVGSNIDCHVYNDYVWYNGVLFFSDHS